MRVCQIGCGMHAKNVYADALRRCQREQGLTLAACCDKDAQRAQAYQTAVGFARYETDYHAMLEKERPDAVLIVTPYPVTPSVATDVLRAGFPCLIEKPPAETLAATEALVQVARESGTWHQVAYNRRHMPLIRALKAHLQDEQVQSIAYRMHRVRRNESHFESTAVHGFDLVSHLAGMGLVRMEALYQQLSPAGVINASFLCRYESGACATLSFLPQSAWIAEQVAVVTERAYYEADLPIWGAREAGGSLRRFVDNAVVGQWTDRGFPDGTAMYETNGFYEQLRVFFTEAGAQTPSPHTLETALDAAVMMDCMRERRGEYTRAAQ